jgi:hypothetical protein
MATFIGALALCAVSLAAAKIDQAIKRRLKNEQLQRDLDRWDSDGCKPGPEPNTSDTQQRSG